jgi:excisionase family DNA binding protein
MTNASLTLTVEQAATMLSISRTHAYELVRRHELPALKLGRRVVIPRIAVETMVERASTASSLDGLEPA